MSDRIRLTLAAVGYLLILTVGSMVVSSIFALPLWAERVATTVAGCAAVAFAFWMHSGRVTERDGR